LPNFFYAFPMSTANLHSSQKLLSNKMYISY